MHISRHLIVKEKVKLKKSSPSYISEKRGLSNIAENRYRLNGKDRKIRLDKLVNI